MHVPFCSFIYYIGILFVSLLDVVNHFEGFGWVWIFFNKLNSTYKLFCLCKIIIALSSNMSTSNVDMELY